MTRKKTAGAQHCCAVVISACDVTIDLLSRRQEEKERERVRVTDHLQLQLVIDGLIISLFKASKFHA